MWWKANRPCLVLLLAALLRPASPTFLEVAKISSVIVKQIWELWQWTGEELKAEGGPGLPFSGGGERLPSRIRELSARLSLQDQMNRYSDGLLYNHLLDLPTTFKYHLQVYSLLDSIFTIERADNTFRDYLEVGLKNINQTGKAFIEDYTLFDFLESVISHKPQSVRSNMDKLHQMIIVDETRSFFNTLGLFDSFLKYFKSRLYENYIYRISVNSMANFKISLGKMMIFLTLFVVAWSTTSEAYRRPTPGFEPSSTDLLREKVMESIDELWKNTGHPDWQYSARRKAGLDGELVIEFTKIAQSIDNLKMPLVPDAIMVPIWVWSVLGIEMSNINGIWTMFRQSQARPDPMVYGDSWQKIADISLHDSPEISSVYNSLSSLQDMIWDRVKGHKNVFQIVTEEAEDQICESQMSPQQLLYNLYAILQMSQLKAYTMIQFSWLLLRLYNKGNFTSEADLMRQNYLDRMSQQALSVKEAMNETDSVLWRCDPRNHEEGKTYTQVTKVLQGFLVNEVDLNKDGTCREDCPFYKYTKQFSCYKENFCQKQPRCNGNIVGCQFVDSDMWVCQSPSSSTRRYDWIEYENGRTLGTKQHCHRPVTKVDSWWRWLFWHCSFCYCFCDDPRDIKSDRYFNLRPSVSDKRKNRVITGIRFTKVNRVIHLQIQEGELLPMGGINASTVEWQPVDAYSIDDEGVTVGTDYHMLTWESRAIDLDDLKLPHNSVLTGIKLRRVGGHLNLEIQGSEFNFTEGKLLQAGEKSYWISNDKTDVSPDNPRTHLKLKNPDVPTKSTGPSVPDSRSVQFIEFTSSDLDLDAGQTTVPFIDAQDVAPNPPTPLSGAGLYHKGRKYSGGFIAPRVFTFDFSLHIKDHFPEINEADS